MSFVKLILGGICEDCFDCAGSAVKPWFASPEKVANQIRAMIYGFLIGFLSLNLRRMNRCFPNGETGSISESVIEKKFIACENGPEEIFESSAFHGYFFGIGFWSRSRNF